MPKPWLPLNPFQLRNLSLTSRVMAFFLLALAGILLTYSFIFYSVASSHIENQFESELRSVFSSLVAAVEVEPTEVKWQPLEHSIDFGAADEFGEILWIVLGDDNQIVDRSRFTDEGFMDRYRSLENSFPSASDLKATERHRDKWMFLSQKLSCPIPDRTVRELDEFDEVTVVVGRSTVLRDAVLSRLLGLVMLLSVVTFGVAMLLGRYVVRRALKPVRDMSEEARAIAGTAFDERLSRREVQDELSELGMAFNRLLDRQQSSFERQRRFAGDAAHELRTPLTIMLGEIEVTLRRDRTPAQYAENLHRIRNATQSLDEIVSSLLFLARSDNPTELDSIPPLVIDDWLDSHRQFWLDQPRGSDLRIESRLIANSSVLATNSLLSRILDNLVLNAMKYSDAGTPVHLRVHSDDTHIVFRVCDQGIGIPDKEVEHLFQPFFRSELARREGIEGTGLGLSIATRATEALRGSLNYSPNTPQGSCFQVQLPRCKPL